MITYLVTGLNLAAWLKFGHWN